MLMAAAMLRPPVGRGLGAVVVLTLREAWRSPVFVLLWAALLLLTGAAPRFDFLALREKQLLVVDSLAALALTGSALTGVLLALEATGGEVRRGGVALWLARGVRPGTWLAGKFIGLALALVPLAVTLALGLAFASRIAWEPLLPDLVASRAWFWAFGGGLVAAAVAVWRGARWGPALVLAWPVALGLAAAAVAGRGQGWAAEDWAVLPMALQAWGGATLLAWVAAVLALRLDTVTAWWVAGVVWLVGLSADYWLTGAARALWAAGPSWALFQQAGGWAGALRSVAYLACYGVALLAWAAGWRGWREAR